MRITLVSMLAMILAASSAHAATQVTWSGTPGTTPISMTLQQSATFNITSSTTSGDFILFAIRNVQATPDDQSNVSTFDSNWTFSINGSGSYSMLGWVDNGYSSGAITSNDSYTYWLSTVPLTIGDVVTLNAGTISTTSNGPAHFVLGTNGSYEMFMINADSRGIGGTLISGPASSIPEPSICGLVGLSFALLSIRRRMPAQA
jgi:hypothetical protein